MESCLGPGKLWKVMENEWLPHFFPMYVFWPLYTFFSSIENISQKWLPNSCQHLRTLIQLHPGLTLSCLLSMSDKKSYCKLWNVVQMLLVLSQLNVPGKT